jgi:double-stranded uracil-DNA glycosylase
MNPIKDQLKKDLKILFVGFNPSVRSAETGHHFANPNNRFWTILYESGLTRRKYSTEEDFKLLDLGYGLTNIVARPTKAADEITNEEYKEGRMLLLEKIKHLLPKVVCFVGKGVYLKYSGKRKADWGVQVDSVIPGVVDFVAPSSSGLVRMKTEAIVQIYKELALLI